MSLQNEIETLRTEVAAAVQAADYATLMRMALWTEAWTSEDEPPAPPPRPAPVSPGHVVYYLLWGDRVKIGTTKNLRTRTRQLYFDRVLAAEPGDRRLEGRRHREFAQFKLAEYREWFSASPELLAHAERIRAEYGAPFAVGHGARQ